jgi:hypothetical protein
MFMCVLGRNFAEFVRAAGSVPVVIHLCGKCQVSVQLPVFCVGNIGVGRPSVLAILIAPEVASCRKRGQRDRRGISHTEDAERFAMIAEYASDRC